MSDPVRDALSEYLSGLTALRPAEEAVGYGSDLVCVDELDPNLAEVDPLSQQALYEACVRALTTARGSIVDDPDFGCDLGAWLNQGMTQPVLAAAVGRAREALESDDRVQSASVAIRATGAESYQISATIRPASLQNFTLVLTVSSGTVLSEAIGVAQ